MRLLLLPVHLLALKHELGQIGPALSVLPEKVVAEDERLHEVLTLVGLDGRRVPPAGLVVVLDVPLLPRGVVALLPVQLERGRTARTPVQIVDDDLSLLIKLALLLLEGRTAKRLVEV